MELQAAVRHVIDNPDRSIESQVTDLRNLSGRILTDLRPQMLLPGYQKLAIVIIGKIFKLDDHLELKEASFQLDIGEYLRNYTPAGSAYEDLWPDEE
jgi:hypothetical protein